MAKPPVRNKRAPSRRPWSKDDLRLLKGMARKEPLAKIAQTLNERRARRVKKLRISASRSELRPRSERLQRRVDTARQQMISLSIRRRQE